MSRRQEPIPYMLVHDCPWWASVILSGIVYVLLKNVAPQLCHGNKVLGSIMQALPGVAWMAGAMLLVFAGLDLYVRMLKAIGQRSRKGAVVRHACSAETAPAAAPPCPACNGTLVQRTARQGGQCWKGLLGLLAVSGVPWNALSENLTNAPNV